MFSENEISTEEAIKTLLDTKINEVVVSTTNKEFVITTVEDIKKSKKISSSLVFVSRTSQVVIDLRKIEKCSTNSNGEMIIEVNYPSNVKLSYVFK